MSCEEVRLDEDGFDDVLPRLTVSQARLVRLYIEALQLERCGRTRLNDRLCAVEHVFNIQIRTDRRRARLAQIEMEKIEVLERDFGIARKWVLRGDLAAMRTSITRFRMR